MWRRSSQDGACIRVSVWWLGLFVVESVSEDLEAQRIAVAHVLGVVVVVRRIVSKNYIFIYICNYDLLLLNWSFYKCLCETRSRLNAVCRVCPSDIWSRYNSLAVICVCWFVQIY